MFHLVPYSVRNCYIPAVIGRIASFVLKVIEYARSFQAIINPKEKAVTIPGLDMGIIILINALNRLHPSILAASSNSMGQFKNMGRSIRITKGTETVAVDKIGAR